MGLDPERLERKGKVIRDLAIELGWDRDKFDGFDQPLLDRVAGLSQPSNDAFVEQHWGASWSELFPQKPAAGNVYLGPQTDAQRADMRRLMVLVIRESMCPGCCAGGCSACMTRLWRDGCRFSSLLTKQGPTGPCLSSWLAWT